MLKKNPYAGFIINIFKNRGLRSSRDANLKIVPLQSFKESTRINLTEYPNWEMIERMNFNRTSKPIENLSVLFPLSFVTGLMPCALDDGLNRRLTVYTIISHIVYRIANVMVLLHYFFSSSSSVTLWSLVTLVAVMKCLCTTVHVVVIIRKRHLLLKLVENCEEDDFYKSAHRRLTKIIVAYEICLYTAGQIIQHRWLAAVRDIFSSIDVLCSIFIILQYCTFLEMATKKFEKIRIRLFLHFHSAEDVLKQHVDNLRFVEGLQEMYNLQMFFCVCYLGFDFFVASYDTMERILSGTNLVWLICTVCYSLLCLSTVYILCRACEIAKAKTEKFNWELFNLMNKNIDLCKNDVLRIYMRIVKPLTFTGSRFFNIGYPLITSIIAAATTYLIFLTQFSIKPN